MTTVNLLRRRFPRAELAALAAERAAELKALERAELAAFFAANEERREAEGLCRFCGEAPFAGVCTECGAAVG